LLQYPSGNAEWGYELRDKFLRRVAAKRDILVPSLVADRRVITGEDSVDAIEVAEHHIEAVRAGEPTDQSASLDGEHGTPSVTCPTCGRVLGLYEAAEHDHLRTVSAGSGGGTSS